MRRPYVNVRGRKQTRVIHGLGDTFEERRVVRHNTEPKWISPPRPLANQSLLGGVYACVRSTDREDAERIQLKLKLSG